MRGLAGWLISVHLVPTILASAALAALSRKFWQSWYGQRLCERQGHGELTYHRPGSYDPQEYCHRCESYTG